MYKNFIKNYQPDIPLLLFLIGVCNIKLYVKVAAVIVYFLYLLFEKQKFSSVLKGVTPFYFSMAIVGTISAWVYGAFANNHYWFGWLIGFSEWVMGGLIFYLLYTVIKATDEKKLINTAKLFFISNLAVTLVQLVGLMIASHHIMPYWYNDALHIYGPSTGDYIRGFLGTSTTNATISALGGFFFLNRRQYVMAACCLLGMLLCTSNVTLIFFCFILLLVFFFTKQKKLSFITLVTLVASYFLLSPMNVNYVESKFASSGKQQPYDSLYYHVQTHKKAFLTVPVSDSVYNNVAAEMVWLKNQPKGITTAAINPTEVQLAIKKWYGQPADNLPISYAGKLGKLYALKQVRFYITHNWKRFLIGNGTGNFSSKLAIKMTGLQLDGHYPEKFIYLSRDFFENNFYTLVYYLSRPESEHSVMNMPNCTYGQLAGEYGIIGLVLFFVFYVGYFWKHRKKMPYGKYLLLLLLLFLGMDYWFEMLSLTVVFEFLMLLYILKHDNKNDTIATGNRIDASL